MGKISKRQKYDMGIVIDMVIRIRTEDKKSLGQRWVYLIII